MRPGMKFLVCPDCGKRGVYTKLGQEDGKTCRYCNWWIYIAGYDLADVRGRKALLDANPGDPELELDSVELNILVERGEK